MRKKHTDSFKMSFRGKDLRTFKHVLWAPRSQISLDNTLHVNKHNIFMLNTININ